MTADTPTPLVVHASDCALHNAPATEAGPCDCGAEPGPLGERINAICHDEQMAVWEDEVLDEFREFLREPQDYEDGLAMHRAANAAIRHIVNGALAADLLRRAGISEPAGSRRARRAT